MKHALKPLLFILAFAASGLVAAAQAPKILVIDMARLYDSHYKTEEQIAKLQGDEQKAREELEKLNAEGNQLVEQYKELVEQGNNPAISATAKEKAQQDAERKLEEIQRKQNEVQSFQANTQRSLQQRLKTFRDLMLEEISKTATTIARRKGANLLLDKSGPSLIGISNVVYVDDSYDITEEVLQELNKDRPAGAAAAGASKAGASAPKAGAAAPKAGAAKEEPTVSFPGAKKN